jgi:death on curing protein
VTDPRFLSLDDVLFLHDDQLERYGGLAGIRDAGAVESAVETPRATFDGEFLHDGVFAMAAAYAVHIAENQGFNDGNKRTALNAALVFLLLNGWHVADPDGHLYDAMIAISARSMTKSGLAKLFQELAVPDEEDEAF